MSWALTIVIALLTSVASAAAAGFLATLCIDWYRISPREGGSGYFVIFIGLTGFLGGLLIGTVTSRFVPSGFWLAQAYSLAIAAAICLVIGLFARLYGEVPPTLAGETLRLEVELKCPRGWQPAKSLHTSSCTLQPMGPGRGRMGEAMYGQGDWNEARQIDEQWVAPCAVNLFTSRTNRYVRVMLATNVDVTFFLPLPGKPKPEHQQWSEWSNQGFDHAEDKPPITNYEFRYRVQRDSVWREEAEAASAAATAAQEKVINAIAADASIDSWLPFFVQGDTGKPATEFKAVERRALDAVKARAVELKTPLESHDPRSVRRAVFAAATLSEVPPELIRPLQKAGRLAIDLINEARAYPSRNDECLLAEQTALMYFFKWDLAIELAGPAAHERHVAFLREIALAVGPSPGGDLATLGNYARQGIERPQ